MRFAELPTNSEGTEFVSVNPKLVALVVPSGEPRQCHVCTVGTLSGSWSRDGGEIESCIAVSLSRPDCVALLEEASK